MKNLLRTSLVAAALLLGLAPAHATAANVVPNPNFEQGGCGDPTPVVCGWNVDPMIHVGSSIHFNCGPVGCYAGWPGLFGVGASTDPAFCAPIGPGAHPASLWYQTSGQEADLTASFFQTADCTGASSSDTLSYSDPNGGPPGFLVAPPGTESALFGVSTYTTMCDDYCYFDADFYGVDVEDTLVTGTAISSFAPDTGPAGTSVDLRGVYFTGATSVTFDGTEASFTVDSDKEIHATVPSGATTGVISVTGPSGFGSSTSSFTVIHPELAPTVSSFTPTGGPVGTRVDILGSNFSGATSVGFNNAFTAAFTVDSDSEIHATVPNGATTGPISVTTANGSGSSSSSFAVPAPAISSFTPTSGLVGTSVDILGSNFTGATRVTFNGRAASFTVDSDSEIHATVPSGATTGPISVTTPNGYDWSSSSFTVIPTPPTINSFTPTSGPAGTSVDILGSDFTSPISVKFNGTPASWTFNSDSEIHATVPNGATTGPISVTTAGGIGTSSSSFTVLDTMPPETTITSGPPATTNSTSATFEFTASEPATFECSLDGGAFSPCASPKTYTGLVDDSHTFRVRATDLSGNADPTPAQRTWTVDTAPPETTIASGPPATTNSTSATFGFTASESSTFECSLDGAPFVACGSPKNYAGLADGSHTFRVRATDLSGNTDPTPVARSWTVDTAPPATTITSGPSGTTGSTSATFEFSASEASTFECSLDSGPFAACASPKTYTGLAEGPHTFRVRATDAAGNTDPTPASRSWTVHLNLPPIARLSFSCTALACSYDGSASSDPDGSIASYSWNFGDGTSGSGSSTTHSYLLPADYLVTLTVTDNDGASGAASTTVPLISLTARGYKQRGLEKVDLSWSGAGGATFDVYRNGGTIATVQGSAYTDNLNAKGSGTYAYKVCAGPVCSNTASVTF